MSRLFVWIRLPDDTLRLAGELGTTDPLANGHFQSEFEYSRDWDATGFSLDPQSLPLGTGSRRFSGDLFNPPLAIFDDALPDDWGRGLLAAALKLEGRRPSPAEMLLRMRGGGTGALLFTETPAPPEPLSTVQTTALATLLAAAARFESGTLPPGDEFRKLLEGSSRAGGARPKALMHDAEGEWLLKFPSKRDGSQDVVGLEATCLTVAKRAGLTVPETRLRHVGRRRVLMVRRFDITPENGRLHMVSLRTLCLERPGIYVQDYSHLAQVVRKHSSSPAVDVEMLFRHMVFNAAIGNVDDHLKNFWMLATPGYRLAPAFDLVPDIGGRGEHTLSFLTSFECPSQSDLLSVAKAWHVAKAAEIVREVATAVRSFRAVARELKVRGGKGLNTVLADIERRVASISR